MIGARFRVGRTEDQQVEVVGGFETLQLRGERIGRRLLSKPGGESLVKLADVSSPATGCGLPGITLSFQMGDIFPQRRQTGRV